MIKINKLPFLKILFSLLLCVHINCMAESLIVYADDQVLLALERMSFAGLNLDLSRKELNTFKDNPVLFKNFLIEHSLTECSTSIASNKTKWELTYKALLDKPWADGSWGAVLASTVRSDELANLFTNAKYILKSFLIKDNNELGALDQLYFKKEGHIHRLFTYAHLQRVIEKKGLYHIHLPHKFLAVYNKDTKSYVPCEQAFEIISRIINMHLDGRRVKLGILIEQGIFDQPVDQELDTHYRLDIFAQRITNTKKPLNEAAKRELSALCSEASFDIGYENIFTNSDGDAIIIDTEAKISRACDCYKIDRYK